MKERRHNIDMEMLIVKQAAARLPPGLKENFEIHVIRRNGTKAATAGLGPFLIKNIERTRGVPRVQVTMRTQGR